MELLNTLIEKGIGWMNTFMDWVNDLTEGKMNPWVIYIILAFFATKIFKVKLDLKTGK